MASILANDDYRVGVSSELSSVVMPVGSIVQAAGFAYQAIPAAAAAESTDVEVLTEQSGPEIKWRRLILDYPTLRATILPGQWDDLQGDINHAANVASLGFEEILDTPVRAYWFSRAQDDSLDINFQHRHGWNLGQVRIHAHIVPAVAGGVGDIVLSGRVCWSAPGLAVRAWADWTPFEIIRTVTAEDVAHAPMPVHLISTVPPALAQVPSAFLTLRLTRPGASNAADTYAGDKTGGGTAALNVGLRGLDCHFQYATLGTTNEFG